MKEKRAALLIVIAIAATSATAQQTKQPVEVVASKQTDEAVKVNAGSKNQNVSAKVTAPINKWQAEASNNKTNKAIEKEANNIHLGDLEVELKGNFTDVAIAAFTAVLVLVSFLQLWIMRSTLRSTKDAADAALKSAEVAHQALVNLERPFIVLDHIDATRLADRNNPQIRVTISNSGRTLAVLGRIDIGFKITADLPRQKPLPEGGAYNFVLPAGEKKTLGAPLSIYGIGAADIEELSQGHRTLYFSLLVKYQYGSNYYATAIMHAYSAELKVFGPAGDAEHNYLI